MKELYEEINSTDFSIREAAYTKVLNDIPQTSSHSKDLSDILLKQKKIYQEQAQDLQSEIISILEEEESIHRIWVCFRALEDPGRKYLEEIYVFNNLYRYVEQTSGVSHRKFEETRSQAMKELIRLYQSDLSNKEIILGAGWLKKGKED
ncbi:hypothetical protein [Sellimonas intestinalis]